VPLRCVALPFWGLAQRVTAPSLNSTRTTLPSRLAERISAPFPTGPHTSCAAIVKLVRSLAQSPLEPLPQAALSIWLRSVQRGLGHPVGLQYSSRCSNEC
jgi:hypothetical protein